ncbi:hypothetical protein [Hymenobacter metallilatus]|uniref:DUF4190 domain-containing protein n=1 Tax=Hymenobacter metallilatus TaxID=2493666 RepID=A0A3R9MVW4_9BACT|nr:hypothetical protein [Hymenobacter metallilatus]RSK31669.1 hypothetical protein EI290_12615 [Hymenobacter metallilatus]
MGISPQTGESTAYVVGCYEKASYSYFTPVAFVLLGFVLDFFLPLALLTALPCSVIGLYFSYKGFKASGRLGYLEKKDVGYANILLGILLFVAGLVSAGFAYVWISG